MKNFDRIAAVLVILVSAAVFGTVLVHALWYAPEPQTSAPPGMAAAVSSSMAAVSPGDYPDRLTIPRLGVNARVQMAGLSYKGNIGVPSNFTDVAWYKYGALPGRVGTAIVDGHVDNGLGLDGVFKHLIDLQAGDDVYVTTKSGIRLHFVVAEIGNYPYQQVPIPRLLAQQTDPELALISCDGSWVEGQRTYDHRLVIYAKLQN